MNNIMIISLAVAFCLAVAVSIVSTENYGNDYAPMPYAKYQDYPSYERDYSFNYGVKDDYTYNYQTRDEVKKGNAVFGSYTVVEPDGNLRVVKYEADDYGFRAVVDREGYGAPVSYGHDSYKPSGSPYPSAGPAYKAPAPAPYKAPAYPTYKAPKYQSYKPAPVPAYPVDKPAAYAPYKPKPVYKPAAYPPPPPAYKPPAYAPYKAPVPAYKTPIYGPPPSYKSYDDEY